jgi:predicted phosphodiesterase
VRTAIISDIHGNLAGMLAALRDAEGCGCGRVICLGDSVDGGPSDVEVVKELVRRGIATVRGNHDEAAQLPRGSPEAKFLDGLPLSIVEGDTVYTHITPRRGERKVRDRYEAWNVFDETAQRVAFIGHVHIPLIFSHRGGSVGAARAEEFVYGRPLRLDSDDRYIVCVGAVGYGRDGVNAVRYGVYDPDARTVEIRRVDAPVLDL